MIETAITKNGLKVTIELTAKDIERKRLVALKKEYENMLYAIRKSIQAIDYPEHVR
jgi:hypothetical protein